MFYFRPFYSALGYRREPARTSGSGQSAQLVFLLAQVRSWRCGMISQVTSRPAAAQHLHDLAELRRVRDRMDREYAQPLDVEALARGVNMSDRKSTRLNSSHG